MAKPKLPKKLYVMSWGIDSLLIDTVGKLSEAKENAEPGDRIGVYELVKEVTNPK